MARTSIRQQVGKKIRKARKAKGLTQEKVALISGLSQKHISEVEGGKQNATVDTLYAIALALGIKFEIFHIIEEEYKIEDNSKLSRHL